MDFGAVLELDPPASRTIARARAAEDAGFSHVWLYDTHVLWEEPYVIMSQILGLTERVIVGPFVTNPITRDPVVTAATFATLNEMFGNRTICGIGRGDSAVRTQHGRPTTLKALADSVRIIRDLGNGGETEVAGGKISLPYAAGSELDVWVAAYGPRALKIAGELADGVVLQLADPDIAAWMIAEVRAAAEAVGRAPDELTFCIGAPAYVGDDRERMLAQNRWFGGLVGNHVADLVSHYGTDGEIPRALTDYIAGRTAYGYDKSRESTEAYVTDEIVERFCIIGSPEQHIEKLQRLAELGVSHFAAYLQHDAVEATMDAYRDIVIPALRESGADIT